MRMVLLRHDLPDGSGHFDWMIEPADSGRGLVTFRTDVRIDLPDITRFDAQRIGEHRREYLGYEGPVSGNRGSVQRVATGTVFAFVEQGSIIEVRGVIGDASGTWQGVPTTRAPDTWNFTRHDESTPH